MGLVVVFLTLGVSDAPEPGYAATGATDDYGSESAAPGFEPLFDRAEENFTIGGESPKSC